ncbi:MAG: tRNA-uridine aminocarboxypropyltransferase [Bacteriovorax sp.]|nr:tRNA-uridine aminocarboxypropyltransferase [Bacteriovorax sp.]
MNKRANCPHCEYILARCLCHTLKSINNKTTIIVLQHPSETKHALNTVQLMKKSFQNIVIFTGEDFSEHTVLNKLLLDHQKEIALVFPTTTSTTLTNQNKQISHLIFIDGTWKKARKIFLLSKNLHQLQTYSLTPDKPGQYLIRSSSIDNSLSTLEACLLSLSLVEKDLDTKSLTNSFNKMIEFQIEKMGEEKFNKNYLKKGND